MTTPHLKPLKKGIAHGRNAYHESEKDTQEMPVFAYMRRSTDKEEQKDSILQQEEGVVHIAEVLGFDLKKARKFTETKSGFENRKRPEWKAMIKEIDQLKTPCVLLCRDTSRLSRNPRDNLIIADRIFGDSKTRKTIGRVYFLGDNFNIQKWDDGTDKKYIVDKLHGNYTESLETKTKSINGHILKLQVGIYPYHPAPKWLESTQYKGRKVLKQNEKVAFIRRAFEMKAERRGHKEISHYLRQYGDIKIGSKELTDRLFTNTVYIGEYTEKNTGQNFKNLLFMEGKPPLYYFPSGIRSNIPSQRREESTGVRKIKMLLKKEEG